MPHIPGQQGNGERGGQGHVHGSGTGKADDASSGDSHQCGVELGARTKSPKEKIDGDHHESRVHGRRQACRPVAHPEQAIGKHGLPVIQRRFFQPGLAAEGGGDPVVTGEHFARDLSVAGFIGADQTKICESVEKQESAETGEQKPIGTNALVHAETSATNFRGCAKTPLLSVAHWV